MPLFSFTCSRCALGFETLLSTRESKRSNFLATCPKCQKTDKVNREISKFKVGGRGDLRESTLHGCHDHFDGLDESAHNHSHGDED